MKFINVATMRWLRNLLFRSVVFVNVMGSFCSHADVIYLKSGRTIEGTVLESNDDEIVIEMAMGSVTLARSSIQKIDRTHAGNERRNLLSKAAEFEQELTDMKRSIASLYSSKGKLSVLRLKVQDEESDVHQIEDKLADLQKTRAIALQELEPYHQYRGKKVPARIYDQYVAAQNRYQTATAQVDSREQALVTERRELARAREVLSSNLSVIAQDLNEIKYKRDQLLKQGCPEQALEGIDKSLRGLDDLKLAREIPLRREGNSFYISVTLNGGVTEEFVLDTGCSTILINSELARRLNLDPRSIVGGGISTIADGSSMQVKNIYLDSVETSGMRAGNVPAQISINDNGNTPLLLGMSYLERFRFSIDAQRGILVLE